MGFQFDIFSKVVKLPVFNRLIGYSGESTNDRGMSV